MIGRSDVATGDAGSGFSGADATGASREGDRRGPGRPLGDTKLPAHIMAAVRQTIHAAALTCVDASRLEASGPYEWLAIVDAHDRELYRLLRGYIEGCRYVDELEHHDVDLGRTRLADALRDAIFARESLKQGVLDTIQGRSRRRGPADV